MSVMAQAVISSSSKTKLPFFRRGIDNKWNRVWILQLFWVTSNWNQKLTADTLGHRFITFVGKGVKFYIWAWRAPPHYTEDDPRADLPTQVWPRLQTISLFCPEEFMTWVGPLANNWQHGKVIAPLLPLLLAPQTGICSFLRNSVGICSSRKYVPAQRLAETVYGESRRGKQSDTLGPLCSKKLRLE